jgi:hypothetical protein
MLSWSGRRQFIFLAAFFLVLAAIGSSLYLINRPRPTCQDDQKNQNELAPDCGGPCSRACVSQLLVPTPTIWWSRVFPSGTAGKFDAAALVENQNAHFGTGKIDFIFRLYDEKSVLLAEKDGSTFFSPQEKFVIYEPNIETGSRVPVRAFLYFVDRAIWQRAQANAAGLSIGTITYNNTPRPTLKAIVTNGSLSLLRGTKFVAVLSTAGGNALAASQTVVDSLSPNESQEINFTWPAALSDEAAVRDIYPKLDRFDNSVLRP